MNSLKIFTVLLFLSWNVYATIESSSSTACEQALTATPSSVFPPLEEAIGLRGFLSATPEKSIESFVAAMEQMIFPWALKTYAVKSVEEARVHNDMEIHEHVPPQERGEKPFISPPMASLYIITTEDPNSYKIFEADKSSAHNKFQELIKITEVFYFTLDGERVVLTPEQLKKFTNVVYTVSSEDNHFFYQRGWVVPAYRGIESISRFMASSKDPAKTSEQVKRVQKDIRTLYRRGGVITFNRAMDEVLKMASSQSRRGSTNRVDAKDPELGNYPKAARDFYLELQKRGYAFSAEEWDRDPSDPEAKLVAGLFGRMLGSSVSVDSLAYSTKRKVRAYDEQGQPLFRNAEGEIVTAERHEASGLNPFYKWENPFVNQRNPQGELEYLMDEKTGKPAEFPDIEPAKRVNTALYVVLQQMGIDVVDVGMVTPLSRDFFGALYETREDALRMVQEQRQRLNDAPIVLPDIFKPEGL